MLMSQWFSRVASSAANHTSTSLGGAVKEFQHWPAFRVAREALQNQENLTVHELHAIYNKALVDTFRSKGISFTTNGNGNVIIPDAEVLRKGFGRKYEDFVESFAKLREIHDAKIPPLSPSKPAQVTAEQVLAQRPNVRLSPCSRPDSASSVQAPKVVSTKKASRPSYVTIDSSLKEIQKAAGLAKQALQEAPNLEAAKKAYKEAARTALLTRGAKYKPETFNELVTAEINAIISNSKPGELRRGMGKKDYDELKGILVGKLPEEVAILRERVPLTTWQQIKLGEAYYKKRDLLIKADKNTAEKAFEEAVEAFFKPQGYNCKRGTDGKLIIPGEKAMEALLGKHYNTFKTELDALNAMLKAKKPGKTPPTPAVQPLAPAGTSPLRSGHNITVTYGNGSPPAASAAAPVAAPAAKAAISSLLPRDQTRRSKEVYRLLKEFGLAGRKWSNWREHKYLTFDDKGLVVIPKNVDDLIAERSKWLVDGKNALGRFRARLEEIDNRYLSKAPAKKK